MAVIRSGASTDELTVDVTSKAARITEYLASGQVAWPDNHPTYSFATVAFAPGATPRDVILLQGSASKTIAVLRVFLSTYQTTAGINTWLLRKFSSAPTGGTFVADEAVPHDSSDAAAAATAGHHTAANTSGTLVGEVWSGRISSPAAATAGVGGYIGVMVDFTRLFGKPLMLRGAGEYLSWNFNGAALPSGLNAMGGMTWYEY